MEASEYKYDVAFSFLAEDEALATELNDLLQARLRTFLYSKKQGEIAGTDGEKSFNVVFGQEARIVVVLYRSNWGQTPWTRIEETAIRNRGYDEGYDFVKLIPLDDPPSRPKWLPRSQLWIGLKRWGVTGAASAIESRVEELGGNPREETVTERAARLERSLQFAEKRKRFLDSNEGVAAADGEFQALRLELEQLIAALRTSAPSISLELKFVQRQIVILGLLQGLSIKWGCYWSNSLKEAQLHVGLWNGHPPFPNISYAWKKPTELDVMEFTFDLLPTEEHCWICSDTAARPFSTKQLAAHLLKFFMDKADARNKDRRD